MLENRECPKKDNYSKDMSKKEQEQFYADRAMVFIFMRFFLIINKI